MNFFIFIVIIFFTQFVGASVKNQYSYAIYPNKNNVISCENEALKLYSGTIDEIRGKIVHGKFYFQIKINRSNNFDKLVLCDLEKKKIFDHMIN